MHSVFLYHAIRAGLDMAIVNAGQIDIYDQIDPALRDACEDVILAATPRRQPTATERLIAMAESFRGTDAVGRESRPRNGAAGTWSGGSNTRWSRVSTPLWSKTPRKRGRCTRARSR